MQSAQRSLDLSQTRYDGGVTDYLEVITAQNAALSDEVTAVNILGRRMASAVLLIEALGGGWDRSSLPQRPECCEKLAMNGIDLGWIARFERVQPWVAAIAALTGQFEQLRSNERNAPCV